MIEILMGIVILVCIFATMTASTTIIIDSSTSFK